MLPISHVQSFCQKNYDKINIMVTDQQIFFEYANFVPGMSNVFCDTGHVTIDHQNIKQITKLNSNSQLIISFSYCDLMICKWLCKLISEVITREIQIICYNYFSHNKDLLEKIINEKISALEYFFAYLIMPKLERIIITDHLTDDEKYFDMLKQLCLQKNAVMHYTYYKNLSKVIKQFNPSNAEID